MRCREGGKPPAPLSAAPPVACGATPFKKGARPIRVYPLCGASVAGPATPRFGEHCFTKITLFMSG